MRFIGGLFLFIFLFIFGFSSTSLAEYRMFTLLITNTKTQAFRLVDSTLDPLQYHYYYPVLNEEIVQYTATWRCYGRTGPDIPVCPNPKAAQGPAPASNP